MVKVDPAVLRSVASEVQTLAQAMIDQVESHTDAMTALPPAGLDDASTDAAMKTAKFGGEFIAVAGQVSTELNQYAEALREAAQSYENQDKLNSTSFPGG
ncbi:WXG100 family type VII secretion target [Mycobacterium montefiorense]|uniref:PE domain-containing protein n=2 Tax=Mycobacterium montefiorense TaxID=154654 RepID=A0ABQ0NUI3_9MYCO|nr:PE domain-containing protein [Mycobacterium montefiorense]GBG40595.1 hypothetical protein MmonteBS_49670 [Mycobacterium montefiorense]GKU33424.1 hypothetical protein NJB14191_07710 [Mycobacterium montefiorense]GKU39235.1 hypothetical protein NJB14192_12300 [Mycobacterium montefiorense]GKU52072.1 hypothetical protein NJB14195_33160 [Mycobacterium montefiorense]GKU61961.1 hypothetical protein NJB18182_24630 [Mycobacterium montefiorense]